MVICDCRVPLTITGSEEVCGRLGLEAVLCGAGESPPTGDTLKGARC